MPLPWSIEITLPPPLFRQPADVTVPACAATTELPYGAAMSSARCPAWKYWLIEPPWTGHTSAAGAGAATRVVTPLGAEVVVPPTLVVGAASGVASGLIGTGVGSGAGWAGTTAGTPRSSG